MEAICPQCKMHYEVGDDLVKDNTRVECPTCQVALSYIQPDGEPAVGDGEEGNLSAGLELESEPESEDSGLLSFDAPVWDGARQADGEVQPTSVPAGADSSTIGSADESLNQFEDTAVLNMASEDTQATEEIEDWAEAAARWATSGFSSDHMPSFVKNDKPDVSDSQDPSVSTGDSPQDAFSSGDAGVEDRSDEAHDPAAVSQTPKGLDATISDHIPPPIPQNQATPTETSTSGGAKPHVREKSADATYVMRGSGEGQSDRLAPWQVSDQAGTNTGLPSTSKEGMDHAGSSDEVAVDSATATQPADALQAPVKPDAQGPRVTVQNESESFALPDTVPLIAVKHHRPWVWVVLVVGMLAAGVSSAVYLDEIKKLIGIPVEVETEAVDGEQMEDVPQTVPEDEPREQVGANIESPQPENTTLAEHVGSSTEIQEKTPSGEPAAKDSPEVVSKNHAPVKLKRAVRFTKQGYALIKKRKFKEAVNRFKKALAADPSYPIPYRGLGISYARLGRHKQACHAYRTYLKMLPKNDKEVAKLKAILRKCK